MSEFLTLVTVALLAFLAPGLSKRIRLPVVVGEIALGMLVGLAAFLLRHFGYEFLATGGAMAFLAEIGFIVLLFLAGLEIDFNMLEDRGAHPVLIGLAVFGGTLLLSYLIAARFGHGLLAALIISTTSLGVVIPTLRETGVQRSAFGQNIIITALIADFGAIILLTVHVFILKHGLPTDRLETWAPFVLIPVFFLIFWVVYRLGGMLMWHRPQVLARFFKSQDPTEGGVRASLALLFLFVAISAPLGVEAVLAAFLAGALISLLFREGALLSEKLYGIGYGFFVPLFFIYLGLTFDFGALADPTVLVLLPALFVITFLVKMVPSLLWWPLFGPRKALALGAISAGGLSLMIAAASIGRDLGLLDASLYSAIIVLAIGMSIFAPMLYRALSRQPRIGPPEAPRTPSGGTPDD